MIKIGRVCLAVVGLYFCTSSGMVLSGALDEQRQRYQQITQAWDRNQIELVEKLMPALENYPLYPYLEHRRLMETMPSVSRLQIEQFLRKYPDLAVADSLTNAFINELARREDWPGVLAFSRQEPKTVEARCHYHYAKWRVGEAHAAWRGVEQLWLTGSSLPRACDSLLTAWRAADQQTALQTLTRMALVLKEGGNGLLAELSRQLPSDHQPLGSALLRLQKDPSTLGAFVRSEPASDFSRSVSGIVLAKLARQDVEKARLLLPTLVELQKMSAPEKVALEEAVAARLIGNEANSKQAEWRDQVLERSQSVALLERRIRLALATADRDGLKFWLERLPEQARSKEEWQYWRAISLLENGEEDKGRDILRRLVRKRGFYPMVAAQKLNMPHLIRVEVARRPEPGLSQRLEIARVRELLHWNLDELARNEWKVFVANHNRLEQEALARYAFEQQWVDLSVQATIVGKLWDHLEERFPVGWPQEFRHATDDKAISLSYAMAIARQESAWDPKARSPVGATGLMQLMPRTAQDTAKKFAITDYRDKSQLVEPQMNIKIGTQYLESVYQQFDHNRILASAAYNAGPARVKSWLNNSNGRLDSVAFIESIPFAETRGYVKNVLAYDAFYRYFLHHQPTKILTDAEWQRHY
ncbi:murein transglycosylase [Serratia microhaemolytica]|uniref:murein transglycosylase n=1 Tax=Serratia microhaemolytica TaxID=2675110 RepID=UPI000FDE0AD7|nr:murein transglycosylase [Serratia microhaemolytica]